MSNFRDRIGLRNGLLMVLNDEAHHTHDDDNEWNSEIRSLHERTPVNIQLDCSATPRLRNGALFPWIVTDYPLKQAIVDQIVKRPMRGLARIQEARSDHASIRYEGYLVAGVERWKEYAEQLKPTSKKPILFIMLTSTDDADDVADWLRRKYPRELEGDRTLVIHTNAKGEITNDRELQKARELARRVDDDSSDVGAIVSVLMLREGWDVQNVTVIVGLRPYTSKANILPEQTIGRGLRLMFRNMAATYTERIDVIGNNAFLKFVEQLEREEEIALETFDLKEPLVITTIVVDDEKLERDIAIPSLSPILQRKKTLAEEIAGLDIAAMAC